MIMRYYGGGIGHLNNTPPQQAHRSDPLNPNSDEMAVEEDEEDDTGSDARPDGLQDIVMNDGEFEIDENDEEGGSQDDDDDGDDIDDYNYDEIVKGGEEDKDEDEEFLSGSEDDSEEEDGYGYASP
jgi:hypothetical protein